MAGTSTSGLASITIPGSRGRALIVRDFLPFGGERIRPTPTEVRLSWSPAGLQAAFHCSEPNPRYRPLRDKGGQGLASPAFADRVVLQIRPSWDRSEWMQVAIASDGGVYADRFPCWPLPEGKKSRLLAGIRTASVRVEHGWRVRATVPWAILGGRPSGEFGLNVLRFRGQSGERSSPVALDFSGEPALDLLLEARLGSCAEASSLSGTLVALPSGARRWQRPARLEWPSAAERMALWRLQETLGQSVGEETLPARVFLAQRLQDLLMLEGFSFHPQGGSWSLEAGDYRPEQARWLVNEALRKNDTRAAFAVLDRFVGQLDRASRSWFADHSPGNVRRDAWTRLDRIDAILSRRDGVVLRGRAGRRRVDLTLSCPWESGFRLQAGKRGFFDPPRGRALDCRRTRNGVRVSAGDLTVSVTRDPWSIVVTRKSPRRRWSLSRGDLAFRLGPSGRVLAVDWRVPLQKDEGLFGFGERFDSLDQRGRVVTLWDLDAWEGCFYTLRNHAYKPIPLYHSTAGHSVFVNSSYRLRADVGHAVANSCRFTQHGDVFDLCVWLDEPRRVLEAYTAMTGRPVRPPRWAFEPWFGGGWGRWKHGPLKDPAAEMLAVARRFAELDVPHAAVYAEGEGSLDPRLFTGLAPMGIRPLTWMNSTLGLEAQRVLLPGVPDRRLPILRHADGSAFPYIDFTHPGALALVRAYWKRYLDLGIAGSMVDFGDLVPEDGVFHDGRRGDAMHNLYAYEYHRTFARVFAERRGEDFVLFSRSAAPGSQRWLCQFAGDHPSDFAGLSAALRGGLNLSACGFSTWGCDIGGYHVWPDPEVYLRWVEWGAFSPLMRCHGTQPREPWEYGDQAVAVYKRHAWIRESLVEYLQESAAEAHRTGWPMMRALPLAFPGERHLAACDDAYLLGPDLLVAPMHGPGDRRPVPFPRGAWTDLWTGRVMAGGGLRSVAAPLETIPVFLREGARVPVRLSAALRWGESLHGSCVSALVVTPPVGSLPGRWVRWDLQGHRDVLYVLLYGGDADRVRLNGETLPALSGAERAACPPGWYRETHRTVIRVPGGLKRQLAVRLAR